MEIPDDLRYSSEHEWVRVEGDVATVGITDYAQDQLGDIVYLDLPAAGTTLAQGAKLGEVESVKAMSDIYAPVGGEVIEANADIADEPEIVNASPYGRGWLVKLRLADESELDSLLDAKAYDELITREMEENTD